MDTARGNINSSLFFLWEQRKIISSAAPSSCVIWLRCWNQAWEEANWPQAGKRNTEFPGFAPYVKIFPKFIQHFLLETWQMCFLDREIVVLEYVQDALGLARGILSEDLVEITLKGVGFMCTAPKLNHQFYLRICWGVAIRRSWLWLSVCCGLAEGFSCCSKVSKGRTRPSVKVTIRFSPDILSNLQLITSFFFFSLMQITACGIAGTSFSCLGFNRKEHLKNFLVYTFITLNQHHLGLHHIQWGRYLGWCTLHLSGTGQRESSHSLRSQSFL